jgi:hypothetical protein
MERFEGKGQKAKVKSKSEKRKSNIQSAIGNWQSVTL